jgi:hypothetical protein
MNYEDWLMHFNPNHDPRNGQFAKGKNIARVAGIAGAIGAGEKIIEYGLYRLHGAKLPLKDMAKYTARQSVITAMSAALATYGASQIPKKNKN